MDERAVVVAEEAVGMRIPDAYRFRMMLDDAEEVEAAGGLLVPASDTGCFGSEAAREDVPRRGERDAERS